MSFSTEVEGFLFDYVNRVDLEKVSINEALGKVTEEFGKRLVEQRRSDLKDRLKMLIDDRIRDEQEEKEEEKEEEDVDENPRKKRRREHGGEKSTYSGPIQLSRARRVTVEEFRGKTLVSIREYYEKDGKQLPGKKGISLTVEQWSTFMENVDCIDDEVKRQSA